METKEVHDPLTVLPQEVALLILSKFTWGARKIHMLGVPPMAQLGNG